MSANVFTIPPERPFLEALAAGLFARYSSADDPHALARVTVLLPTRRAVRALADALLSGADTRAPRAALVLPRLRALGDVDEETLSLSEAELALDLPSAMPALRARLLLARLIQARDRGRHDGETLNAAQAVMLARALDDLLARVEIFGADLSQLASLVPEALAGHWQETLEFLRIVTEAWPAILAEQGAVSEAARRNTLLARLAECWRRTPPRDPVIAAGSTGTVPATARLLAVVASLPQGAVVLPGLDLDLEEEAWALVDESHSQGAMKALLAALGIARDAVAIWPWGAARGNPLRTRALAEALKPAEATDSWAKSAPRLKQALTAPLGLSVIDAPHPALEAEAIALILRRALETPDETAALVTPDRGLARRVAAALERYGVAVDDSAGMPLSLTPPGVFLRLLAQAVVEALAPVPLLALLKHPFTACGMSVGKTRALARALEREVLRGPRPAPGLEGLRAAAKARSAAPETGAFLERLAAALGPFVRAVEKGESRLEALLKLHLGAAEALASDGAAAGAARLWTGAAGEALASLFANLLTEAGAYPTCPPTEYPALIEALMAEHVVRQVRSEHPRLFIWGPLEARLQRADTIVLGGLNEGTWPAEVEAGPWLSRPMAKALGLPSPEQRLGLSAHDFVQCVSQARRAYLTRSDKVDQTPTVASRWIVRLRALLSGLGRAALIEPDEPWLGWVLARDAPLSLERCAPPEPRPPVAARPRTLSVTQIERYLRDPYAIYACHILRLKPLEPIDAQPDALVRGDIVHTVFQRLSEQAFDVNAPNALERLLAVGRDVFAESAVPPAVAAVWWPRFVAAAERFVDDERRWTQSGARLIAAECTGRMTIDAPAAPFTLTARADRIDRMPDGTLAIFDYKTGQAPTEPQARSGLAPQLPLEAAIAQAGGFEGIEGASVTALGVIRFHPRGVERKSFKDPNELAVAAIARLERLIARYDDERTPYKARLKPMFQSEPGEYDHLSRLKEWSAEGAGDR